MVAAQMEGAIGFGLSPAVLSEITFDGGRVSQSNFHDYKVLRMQHMPNVAVHIVPSSEPPTVTIPPVTGAIVPIVANTWSE